MGYEYVNDVIADWESNQGPPNLEHLIKDHYTNKPPKLSFLVLTSSVKFNTFQKKGQIKKKPKI